MHPNPYDKNICNGKSDCISTASKHCELNADRVVGAGAGICDMTRKSLSTPRTTEDSGPIDNHKMKSNPGNPNGGPADTNGFCFRIGDVGRGPN